MLELQIERGKLTDAKNKLKLSQLKEEFPSNFNLESRTLNPVFTDQSLKSLQNLEKVPFKMKSCNDNILNRPVLKHNSNPTSQNIPLDSHHANLQLSLKPESHIDISHSNKIPIESHHHNKKKTAKGIRHKTLEIDNETKSSIESVDQFINYSVEGKETVISVNEDQSKFIVNALQQELESRQLPPLDLVPFDGNPCFWPEFIENFKFKNFKMHIKR